MIKLRKILLCNLVYYLILILVLISVVIRINIKYISIYNPNIKKIEGNVSKIDIDGNRLKLTIDAKENIIGTYYFKKEADKKYFLKTVEIGDKLLLEGELSKIKKTKTKELFNYQEYLKRKKIFYTIKIDKIYFLSKNTNLFYAIKNKIIKRCKNPYLKTFILGDTSEIDSNILSNYRDIGISHLFAISGMHITLLSGMILSLLKKLKIKENTRYLIVNIFLLFYLSLTGITPSVLRTVLFFFLFSINKIYYFYVKNTNVFILTVAISLIINPYFIYEVSFQYSFVISYALIVLGNYINQYQNYIIKLLITSLISFIVSIPITLYHFNQVNIFSIIYNLFYVPFISVIVFPLAIISFFIPIGTNVLDIFIKILEYTASLLNKINISKLIFPSIPLFFYYFYILLIILFFYGVVNHKKKITIFLFISLTIHYLIPYLDKSNYLLMIDVGQGDSILIHSKGKNILIDTGGIMSYEKEHWEKRNKENSIVKNTTIPLLKKNGIKKIDYLILTHGDYDHLGETLSLINNFKVKKILINEGKINYLEKEIIQNFPYVEVAYKDYYFKIGDAEFLQLNKDLKDENDSSLVFLVIINSTKVLLTGDASIKTEEKIMKNYNLENIDILKLGHHGSDTSSSKKFINSINPKTCLISVGENNKFGHPKKSVLDTLDNCNIYRIDLNGSIKIKI